MEWCGFVESKIRLLIRYLEQNEDTTLVHVNPKCFELFTRQDSNTAAGVNTNNYHHISSSPFCSMWFIGLQFIRTKNLNVDFTENILNFTTTVYHLAEKLNVLSESMEIEIRHISRKQLDEYLNSDFINQEREYTHRENISQNSNPMTEKRLPEELNSDSLNIKRCRIDHSG